jgi:hypothetical protein
MVNKDVPPSHFVTLGLEETETFRQKHEFAPALDTDNPSQRDKDTSAPMTEIDCASDAKDEPLEWSVRIRRVAPGVANESASICNSKFEAAG